MFGLNLGIEVAKYAWRNRKAIGRAYHSHVHHGVWLDKLIDYAEENPQHPKNQKENKSDKDQGD